MFPIFFFLFCEVYTFDPTRFLGNYDKRLNPYYVNNETLLLNVAVPFVLLGSVLTDEKLATILYGIDLTWIDERLKFDPKDYNNSTYLYLPSSEIWTPRYSIYNAFSTKIISNSMDSDVRIESNGRIEQSLIFNSKVHYDGRIKRFPFDNLSCGIQISTTINMTVLRLQAVRGRYSTATGNEEFTLVNFTAITYLGNEPGHNQDNNEVHFYVTLQRRSIYFIIVVIIPTTLVSCLTVTSILSPTSKNNNIDPANIGLNALLALSINLSVVANNIPRTTYVPLIGWFVLVCLAVCVASIGFGLFLAKLKQMTEKGQKSCLVFLIVQATSIETFKISLNRLNLQGKSFKSASGIELI